MAKRWRKQPDETGLARVCQSQRGYQLREGGEILAQVAPKHGGWYWYGFGINTASSPVETLGQAKAQVINHIKSKGL